MPATSSAPGSQPQSVARANERERILAAIHQATQTGQAATGVAHQIAKGTQAVQTAQAIAQAPTAKAGRRILQRSQGGAKAKAARQQRQAQAQAAKQLDRIIAKEPAKATRKVEKATHKLARRIERRTEVELPRPKVELGQHTQPKGKTLEVSKRTARQILVRKPKGEEKVAKGLLKLPHPDGPPPPKTPKPVRRAVQKAKRLSKQAEIYVKLSTGGEGLDDLTKSERRFNDRMHDPERTERKAQAQSDRLWREAKSVSGLRGPAPEVRFGRDLADQDISGTDTAGAAGRVRGKKRVDLAALPEQVAGLPRFIPGAQADRTHQREVLLHEFAHVGQQRSGNTKRHNLNEGRADRFAKVVTEKLGKNYKGRYGVPGVETPKDAYREFRKRSRKTDTRQDILRGQFDRPAAPKPKKPRATKDQVKARKTIAKIAQTSADPDAKAEARAAIKYGKRYGIEPSVLFSQLEIETPTADHVGPPTPYGPAKGNAQFIQGTRDSILEQYGVDAYKDVDSAVHAQALLLRDSGYHDDPEAAIFAYNHSQAYVQDVLGGAAKYAALDKINRATKPVPKKTVSRFEAIVDEAKKIDSAKLAYSYGAGHVAGKVPGPRKTQYDCSSAVSRVLQSAGVKLPGALVSGDLATTPLLKDGPGAVTIYANAGHVFMKIGNRYWGTSQTNPQGGAGFIPEGTYDESYLSQYTVRHVPGLGKEIARRMGVRLTGTTANPGMSVSSSGTTATITDGTQRSTPGPSSKPILSDRAQRKRAKGRRMQAREKQRLLRDLIAQGPAQTPESEPSSEPSSYDDYARNREVEITL